jgi:hypothetical protein
VLPSRRAARQHVVGLDDARQLPLARLGAEVRLCGDIVGVADQPIKAAWLTSRVPRASAARARLGMGRGARLHPPGRSGMLNTPLNLQGTV